MKLYTEEQVKKMLEVCRDSDLYEHILTFEDILKTETPIELPSDAEIEQKFSIGTEEQKNHFLVDAFIQAQIFSAKWMRDKIINL